MWPTIKNVLWIDNLHSALSHVISRGTDCTLSQIPHYIVGHDKKSGFTTIYDPYHVVDLRQVHGALTSADIRLSRVDENVRRVNYTIGDFMDENEFDRDHMTIPFECYDDFNDETDRIVTGWPPIKDKWM